MGEREKKHTSVFSVESLSKSRTVFLLPEHLSDSTTKLFVVWKIGLTERKLLRACFVFFVFLQSIGTFFLKSYEKMGSFTQSQLREACRKSNNKLKRFIFRKCRLNPYMCCWYPCEKYELHRGQLGHFYFPSRTCGPEEFPHYICCWIDIILDVISSLDDFNCLFGEGILASLLMHDHMCPLILMLLGFLPTY